MANINKKFETNLEMIASEFMENLSKYEEIVSIHHTDADGIGSGILIREMVNKLRKPLKQYSNPLELSWSDYLKQLSSKLVNNSAIILSDCAPDLKLLSEFLNKHPTIHVYILDHHKIRMEADWEIHENIYNCNPTQFGLNGLKEIVGATLNYLFITEIDESHEKLAWIATMAMAGDTLQHFEEYSSYNKLVADQAIRNGDIDVNEGLCVFGGQYERLDKALSQSILPYIPQVKGDQNVAKKILSSLNIEAKIKPKDLYELEVQTIVEHFQIPNLYGQYLTIPKKRNILHYTFEHAQLVSKIGHKNPSQAFRLISNRTAAKEEKEQYLKNITGLIGNLTAFMKLPKIETSHSIIADLSQKVPLEEWSDTGSFATINKLFDPLKILIIGGETESSMKLSVRCTKEFIEKYNGKGVNNIIPEINNRLGGTGGGHGLAGGMRIPVNQMQELDKVIDDIVANL